jgi:NAD(P)-dependent dehydrogenase (short-subunit alcohol dehydrogenase family)
VNAIVPGYFHTELTDGFKDKPFYDELIRRVPAGRWGEPEELAERRFFSRRTLPISSPARRWWWTAASRPTDSRTVCFRPT